MSAVLGNGLALLQTTDLWNCPFLWKQRFCCLFQKCNIGWSIVTLGLLLTEHHTDSTSTALCDAGTVKNGRLVVVNLIVMDIADIILVRLHWT